MRYLLAITVLLFLNSCTKARDSQPSGKSIDFYYISEYKKKENSFKIIESSVVISDSTIIDYADIISYSSKDHTFIVNDKISNRLNDANKHYFHGVPFALTIDKEIIYTGYFWASFSSQICDWITIDPLSVSGNNELRVRLGYPTMMDGDSIPDNRNDPSLINTLKQDNKLKD
jgi:hypothetical protein